MGCGCNAKQSSDPTRTRAGMCLACRGSRDGERCRFSGVALTIHAGGLACPKRRHPVEGVVRWLGIRWYGVPWPLRIWLVFTKAECRLFDLPGCGCMVWAKRKFGNIKGLQVLFGFLREKACN